MSHFEELVADYEQKAKVAILAEEKYRLAHCTILANSEAKNEAGRKAEADMATTVARLARDSAVLDAKIAEHRVIHARDRREAVAS